jgi:hypothetical protein
MSGRTDAAASPMLSGRIRTTGVVLLSVLLTGHILSAPGRRGNRSGLYDSSRARLELSQERHERVQLIRLERGPEGWHVIATVRYAPRQLIGVEPTTDSG